jgi:hypothetical protein
MIGDQDDMRSRLRLALPSRWFADTAPVLDGVLAGLGAAWAGLHGLLGLVRVQSRLLTSTEGFLDLSAQDLFGGRLPRRAGEADGSFRARIGRALHRGRATRAALLAAAAEEGAGAMRVFEPAQPRDTGVYGGPRLGWGVAGGWGSLAMPLECLAIVQRSAATDASVRAALVEALPAGGAAWVRFVG